MSRLLEAMQQTPAAQPQSVYFSAQQQARPVSPAWRWVLGSLIVLCLVFALILTGLPSRLLSGWLAEPTPPVLQTQELVEQALQPEPVVTPAAEPAVQAEPAAPANRDIRVVERQQQPLRSLNSQIEQHRQALLSAELWKHQNAPEPVPASQPEFDPDLEAAQLLAQLQQADAEVPRGPEASEQPIAVSAKPRSGEMTLNSEQALQDGVSQELLAKFEQALVLSDTPQELIAPETELEQLAMDIQDLPQVLKEQMPELHYQSHVYSTDLARRTVMLNDVTYREGDWIDDNLQLLEIRPRQSILRYGRQSFRLPALEDYLK